MTPPGLIPQNPNQEIITEAANLYGSHVYWAGPRSSWRKQKRCTVLLRIVHHYPNLIYFYEVPLLHDILVRSFQCDVGPCVVPSRTEVAPQFRQAGDPSLYGKSPLDRLAALQIG